MKINAIDLKPGNVLEHQSKLWIVLKRELVQLDQNVKDAVATYEIVDKEFKEAELKGSQLLDQAARKAGQIEGMIQNLRVERDSFEARVRSAVEQHLRLLDMHRKEEDVEDRLRFMKKPPAGEAR